MTAVLAILLASSPVASIQDQVVPIQLVPPAVHLEVGEEYAVTTLGSGADTVSVQWLSSDPEVAQVSAGGVVTALAPGASTISVRGAGFLASMSVTVASLPAVRLEVFPSTVRVFEGTGAELEVIAFDRDGASVLAADMSFESSAPSVVRADREGRLWARSGGASTIRVRSGDISAEVRVEVASDPGIAFDLETPVDTVRTGDVLRLTVGSSPSAGAQFRPEWSLRGPDGLIEADGAEGVFVAAEPGSYRVMARIGEERVRTTDIEVIARPATARIELIGRGPIADHNSGDMWVFEGVDGRDYVYVGTYMHDWMKVWDVTDPAAPALVDSLQLDARRINDVKINADATVGILTREGASDRRNGMVLLDLKDPAHPTILTEYRETLSGGVHNVWIEGDVVYAVHNATSNIHILDISDPLAPNEVGIWGLDRPQKTLHDIIVQDGYLYASYWDDGVVILDVGAGTHGGTAVEPEFVSRLSYPEGQTHVAWRQGKYLFVGDEIFPPGWSADRPIDARGYVHVLDMTDMDNPVEVARYEVPEAGAHNLWAEGDRLYVGYYQGGLRVLDISGELRGDLYAQGREIAAFRTADENSFVPNWSMTWGAQLFKGRIYSSDLNSGIWITRLIEGTRIVF